VRYSDEMKPSNARLFSWWDYSAPSCCWFDLPVAHLLGAKGISVPDASSILTLNVKKTLKMACFFNMYFTFEYLCRFIIQIDK